MAGGILQLLIYGAQDLYLTANPQITYFKVVFRKHTNFSMETFERTFNDNPNFGKIGRVKIYRLGDLMTKMYLKIILNKVVPNEGSKFAWIRRLGHALLRSVSIEIGGVDIDEQCGTWLDIWYELARQGDHEKGYNKLIGDVEELTSYNNNEKPEYTLFIPLKFWFNRFCGLALPNIAIHYHEIYIKVKFEEINKLIVINSSFNNFDALTMLDVSVLVDYIYLDIVERRKFATLGHEYLIEQVQFTGEETVEKAKKRFLLHYNFPTKELFWAWRNGNYTKGKKFLCYTNKDDWSNELISCSKNILLDSSILLDVNENAPDNGGLWEVIGPNTNKKTENKKINVFNNSDKNFWINTNSLIIDSYSLTNKIQADIIVTNKSTIIRNIITTLSERDISIPVDKLNDTRIVSDDVCVNQFSNYGILITGKYNPVKRAKLEINDQERFDQNGTFFNYLQPEMHHSNTPKDGINCYSFSLQPEKHQPMGTINLSRIERIILFIDFEDISKLEKSDPDINFINDDNRLYIFGFSYNVLKILSGLVALSYHN